MAIPLALSESEAKTTIVHSENKTDQEGRNVGHTRRLHVDISRFDLMTRMEAGPSRHDRKEVFWRSAFIDIHNAAKVLSDAITALANNRFVANFSERPDGEFLIEEAEVPGFWARDQRGRIPAGQVHIYARKMAQRPHGLHLITFFPVIRI
ncbi:hypothetical protein RB623_21695 [Mesorhizobium sp. LHD-90]|uniref:hypothetical protein n=1 Tax=Mesorhizobium sp. LHD-90 TaxID=3071414 RepID=UPI0027E0A541|nr:hypothetical protein [Mesorhizobium sp. LHD-90]MDQ6436672.1 hypothetical protein [Mesorhizobium sp. LHD-90]